ncbi:MAG: hypothetical protein B5M54_05045 [Candidatus Aminicenantes bacterium 4484_214]|nr:MAG: hypothetical protein B5M54_05045 [Candidatus Aminicenantes bacterium 4484_214]
MTSMGIALVIYVSLFFILGISMVKLVRGSGKRYIVCGKSLPLLFVATMLTAQAIDANSTIGNSSLTYASGFWMGFIIPLGLAACLLITGTFFAAPLNRMKLLTLPDFYFRRYGSLVELLTSGLMGLSFIILIGGNFAGAAWIVSVVFKTNYLSALILVAIVILLYTTAGGLFASAATDFVQIYPAIIGFLGGFLWLLISKGWGFFAQSIPPGFLSWKVLFSFQGGAWSIWGSFFALALGDVVALDFMERIFAARTPQVARRGCYIGAALTIISGISCSFLGLMGLKLFPQIADSRMVLPMLALSALPFIFGLLILAGVIGAGASTANGGILGVSTVLGRNILQKNILKLILRNKEGESNKIDFTDRKLLIISRLMALPVVGLAVVLAWVKPEPGILLVLAFDVVFAGCFVPLAGGIYWKKANAAGAVAAIVAGSLLRVILYIVIPEPLKGLDTLLPPLLSLLVFIPVSLATQKKYPPNHEAISRVPTDEEVISGVY